MSNKIMYIFLIFLIIRTTKLINLEQFEIGSRKTYKLEKRDGYKKYFILSDFQDKLLEGNLLEISSIPKSYQNPGYLYASYNPKLTTADNRIFYSQNMGTNKIFINIEKLVGQKLLTFTVYSNDETEMTIEVKMILELSLSLYEKIHFKLSDASKILLPTKDINAQKVFIYITAENIFNFNIDLTYKVSYKTKTFETIQKFPNGKGAIISMSEITEKENGNFILFITADEKFHEQTLNVGFEISDEGDNIKTETEILEHKYGATLEGENCYQMKSFNNSKNATMLINTYSQYLTFTIKKDGKKRYSMDVFNNYFIKIPSLFSNITTHYFCFKKFTPKEEETENLGVTSYDFQIYYDQDYLYHQTEIFPLINGQIYIHSISSGDIFIYRHHSFTNLVNEKDKVYSANLLAIRGKPSLYGYNCASSYFHHFSPDFFNGNSVKSIGQHSILKIINPFGNTKEDPNGDPVSELAYQYFTVVKCESDILEPNKGECKYAIEINNDLDIIQLSPEITFATITTYPINYFHIKITDYQTIKYLKIFFTSLTGNANIVLYEDRNFQNLINLYNFRHVHKKQIIEITENFKEDYYIKVTSSENSFIELKYETEFFYKGYTMLSPNEVNIEYINKKNGFQAFEIQNPHYFYPINNKRNNDFYFTINTLDCSMTYKYNFIDFNGIESVHHEIKKNDINFGTSYGFMVEVDNYYHTVSDDTEDCAIIIYNGEKSKDTPLIMIENIPHPSNFSEIYYIYPFIYDSSFSGIFVDIKYDYESLSKTNKSHLIQLIIKIGDNEIENRKYIANDYTFFLEKYQVEDKCNLQCSLNITILKDKNLENENEISYTLFTNVYRANSLSPEYIYKNNVYNYKILANGAKYFYTQIDLNEEGELNCNFLEGNGIVWAKIVRKDEIEENFNWNNRVKLPEPDDINLLKYDPIYQSIKYTKEDTKKCEKGCELYFKIKSEEISYNTTEFSEFSFNVNDKKKNIVTIRFNDYIKGNLEKGEKKNYKIKIPLNCIKIAINLYSHYGKAKIKYGENLEWDIIPENKFERLIITNETIKKQTLKGEEFLINISTKDLPEGELKDHYLDYYLQIHPLYNDEKEYYHLTSERSIICHTGNDTFCHVLIYQSHYYNNKTKLVYALPMNEYKEINIYYSTYPVSAFNELYPEYTQSLKEHFFPTKYNADKKSEKKEFLLLGTNEWKKHVNFYIYLTIDCGVTNSSIKLILSGNYNKKTLLKNNHDKVIALYDKITFLLPTNDTDYILYVKNINNTSVYFNFLHSDYYIDNYFTEIPKGNSFDLSIYKFGAIYINIQKKCIDNIYKINKNERNKFNYTGEIFPQYIYTDLRNAQRIQFSFLSFSKTKYEEKNSFDLFNIEAFIIDQKNLDSRIISSQYKIQGEKINTYFLKFEEIGIIEIPYDKIPAGNNYYTFVKIEKSEENKNKYKQVITDYSVIERIEGDETAINIFSLKTYFSKLDNNHKRESYIFYKTGKKYLIIDIAENIPFNDTFSFLIYGSTSYTILDYYGRKRIRINNFDQCNNVILYINKKENTEEQSKNYSITYTTEKDLVDYYKFQSKFNKTIVIKRDNYTNKSILTIKNIFDRFRVKYTLNIYAKKDETNSFSKINTIYSGTKHKNEVYSKIFETQNYEEFINIELNYTKEDLKKKYLVRIIADRTTYNEVIERYIYNSTLVDPEEDESEDKDDKGDDEGEEDSKKDDKDGKGGDGNSGSDGVSLALIIPLIIVGITIILVGIFFYLKKRRTNISKEAIEGAIKPMPLQPLNK